MLPHLDLLPQYIEQTTRFLHEQQTVSYAYGALIRCDLRYDKLTAEK